jgi:hypothetical protein
MNEGIVGEEEDRSDCWEDGEEQEIRSEEEEYNI